MRQVALLGIVVDLFREDGGGGSGQQLKEIGEGLLQQDPAPGTPAPSRFARR
jgi:hypothetical protein